MTLQSTLNLGPRPPPSSSPYPLYPLFPIPYPRINAELQAALEREDAVTAALQESGKPAEAAGAAGQAPTGSQGDEAAKAAGAGGVKVKKEGEEGPVADMGTGLDEAIAKSKVRKWVGARVGRWIGGRVSG